MQWGHGAAPLLAPASCESEVLISSSAPPARPRDRRLGRLVDGARLAAWVTSGWVLCDLADVLSCAEPYLVLSFAIEWLVCILLGALLGGVAALSRGVFVLLLFLALGAVAAPRLGDLDLARAHIWLPRCVFLWLVALGCAHGLFERAQLGRMRSGLAMGVLAGVGASLIRFGLVENHALALGGVALGSLALGRIRAPVLRRAVTGLVALVPIFFVGLRVQHWRLALRPDLGPPGTVARAGAPNLVLIVLDTVRADHLASYGYDRVTTPGLDAFARDQATLYTQARSTSPFTAPSHASLFTGLLPSEHGSARPRPDSKPLRKELTTLAERLREQGYQTAAIISNGYYLNHRNGYAQGFEHYDDAKGALITLENPDHLLLPDLAGRGLGRGKHGSRTAETITDRALRWLAGRRPGTPFFLFLNYLDAHSPYIPPAPYDRAFEEDYPLDTLNPDPALKPLLYDRELLYMDHHVTRFLNGLEASGAAENSLVVVTSDHGEALGERGIPEHCWSLYENVMHVPLMIKPAGGRRRLTDDVALNGAGLHDLMLGELGIAYVAPPREDLIGEWYPGEQAAMAYMRLALKVGINLRRDLVAWMEGSRKVIVTSHGDVEAYDLGVDPDERVPLELGPIEIDAALLRARDWWQAHPLEDGPSEELDEETLKGMRALGYLGDG